MSFPKSGLNTVPCLATDDITRDCDEVRTLLCHHLSNQMQCLLVEVMLVRLAKVKVSELHDDETIFLVHFEMNLVQRVEVVSTFCYAGSKSHG